MRGCAFSAEKPGHGCTGFIESGTMLPGTFVAVGNDASVDQSRSLRAEFFSVEAIPLQIAWAPVSEEHVGILQQMIKLCEIVFGVVEYGLTHPNLNVPNKRLDLGI